MNTRLLIFILRLGLLLLRVPFALFWRFAEWRARLQTCLDHALVGRNQPTPKP